jgi:hypothetical protein
VIKEAKAKETIKWLLKLQLLLLPPEILQLAKFEEKLEMLILLHYRQPRCYYY